MHDPHVMSGAASPAHVTMPAVHRIASLLKRWLLGTHQGAISAEPTGLLFGRIYLSVQPAFFQLPRLIVLSLNPAVNLDRTSHLSTDCTEAAGHQEFGGAKWIALT
jgi:hypothetical protein